MNGVKNEEMEREKSMTIRRLDVDAKWDACMDLALRRFVYSSLAGGFGGLLLFRSPVTRWASVAFGAGVGVGSACTDCCHIFCPSSQMPAASNSNASSLLLAQGNEKDLMTPRPEEQEPK